MPSHILTQQAAIAEHRPISPPLERAARDGLVTLCRRALAEGADIEGRARLSKTALHLAANWLHLGVTRVLIEHGANLHAIDASGRTVLHNAVVSIDNNALEYIQLLVQSGAKLDFVPEGATPEYFTPFEWAMKFGPTGTVQHLLEHHGELVEMRTLRGKSLYEIASAANLELLLSRRTAHMVETAFDSGDQQRQPRMAAQDFGVI